MDAALPPGPREPAALQTLEWVARPTAFLRRCAAAHGEAFTIRLVFDDAPLVLVWHPDAVRAVYAASPDVARRGASPGPLRPVAGPRSILFADGEPHLRIRRLMLPAFHGERIAAYREVVHEVATAHVAEWPHRRPAPRRRHPRDARRCRLAAARRGDVAGSARPRAIQPVGRVRSAHGGRRRAADGAHRAAARRWRRRRRRARPAPGRGPRRRGAARPPRHP